jgi:hypothetical protein
VTASPRQRYVPHDDGSAILVVLYDGAYGKTLRLDTQRLEALQAIRSLFRALAAESKEEVHLAGQEGFILGPPLADVVAVVSGTEGAVVSGSPLAPAVTWAKPREEWNRTIGLLDGLADRARQGGSGHQYLTPENAEVLVELSYAE